MKCILISLSLLIAVFSLTACGSSSQGKTCCDCVIENGCWDYGSCPNSTHCYCIHDENYSGDCPSYEYQCLAIGAPCFGSGNICTSECTGVLSSLSN